MKLIEAINKIDAIKPNAYTQTEKVEWISALDGMVQKTVIDLHEKDEGQEEWQPYTDDTPLDTDLLIPHPYDEAYLFWLEQKIDYYNGEYEKYNNASVRFMDVFQEYSSWYTRSHMPIQKYIRYF